MAIRGIFRKLLQIAFLGFLAAGTGGLLARPSQALAKGSSFVEADKELKGEVKRVCPVLIEDPLQGSLKLNRDGSFAKVGKGRFDVRGGWDVSHGKIVLTWSDSEDTLSFPVQSTKEGILIDGHAKDKASGKFLIGGGGGGADAN